MKTDPAYDGRRARRRGLPPVPVHGEHRSGNPDTKEMPPRLPPPEPPLLGRPLSSLPEAEPAGIIRDHPRLIFKPSHALAAILVLVLALATSLTLFVQQSISLAGSAPQAGEAADGATGGKPVGGKRQRSGKGIKTPAGGSGLASEPAGGIDPAATANGAMGAENVPGPASPSDAVEAPGAGAPTSQGGVSGSRVDVNTATADQLQGIKGIGPVMAQRIVEHRNRTGRFSSVDQLLDIPGIGPKTLDKLRPFLVVQ